MYKIVAIEDHPVLRLMLFDLLTIEGHAVTLANDYSQSLYFAQKLNPDLIICNVNVPQVNRYEILRQLRKNIKTSQIPVAFLMAESFLDNQFYIPELEPDRVLAITAELIDLPQILVSNRNNGINVPRLSLCSH